MKKKSIMCLFFICITSYACAMENTTLPLQEESSICCGAWECIESMRQYYVEDNTPKTLDDILHLPIAPKNKYDTSISSEISRISPKNYDLLCKQYEDKKDILWTFVRLPQEIQKNIVVLMIKSDAKMTWRNILAINILKADIFTKLPFLYALENYHNIMWRNIPRARYPKPLYILVPKLSRLRDEHNYGNILVAGTFGGVISTIISFIACSKESISCCACCGISAGGTAASCLLGTCCWCCCNTQLRESVSHWEYDLYHVIQIK